jgi:hypothetical protein
MKIQFQIANTPGIHCYLYIYIYIYNIGVLMVKIEFIWRGLETGERQAFSESFQPFRAELHTFYIYRQYTNIVFILQ